MALLSLKRVESNMMKLQCPVFPYRLISAIILLLLRSSHVVTQKAGEFPATLIRYHFSVFSFFTSCNISRNWQISSWAVVHLVSNMSESFSACKGTTVCNSECRKRIKLNSCPKLRILFSLLLRWSRTVTSISYSVFCFLPPIKMMWKETLMHIFRRCSFLQYAEGGMCRLYIWVPMWTGLCYVDRKGYELGSHAWQR